MIIAIHGLKQSGKSTVGEYLRWCYGFKHLMFAGKLKAAAAALCYCSATTVESIEWKDAPLSQYDNMTGRQFLQRLGDAMKKEFGEDYWIRTLNVSLEMWVEKGENIVITDMRMPNEYEYIQSVEGAAFHIYMGSFTDKSTDTHRTEAGIRGVPWDYSIANNGTLDELYASVDVWMKKHGFKAKY